MTPPRVRDCNTETDAFNINWPIDSFEEAGYDEIGVLSFYCRQLDNHPATTVEVTPVTISALGKRAAAASDEAAVVVERDPRGGSGGSSSSSGSVGSVGSVSGEGGDSSAAPITAPLVVGGIFVMGLAVAAVL